MPSQLQTGIVAAQEKIPAMNHKASARKSSVQYRAPQPLDEKIPGMSSRNRHKPWPSRKVTIVDDFVKDKSKVPSYLNSLDEGENVQDKALNFGVLEWGHLDKWRYLQKQVTNRRVGDSPLSSNATSSPFSTSGSSDRSIDSPDSRKKPSPTLAADQNSRISHDKASIEKSREQGKTRSSDTGSSPCYSKDNDTSDFSDKTAKARIDRSKEVEISRYSFSGNIHFVESMWDRVQECVLESPTSYDSAVNGSSVGIFPPTDNQITTPPVSENEVLNANANAKAKDVKPGQFTHGGSSDKFIGQAEGKTTSAPRRDSSPQRLLRAGLNRIRSSGLRETSAGQPIKQTGSDNSRDETVASTGKDIRSSSPQRLLSAGLNLLRNSSSREASSELKMRSSDSSDTSYEDDATSNSRSRRSPLRRIFDPLKPKNQIHVSGPVTSLSSHRVHGASTSDKPPIRDELKSVHRLSRSFDVIVDPLTSQVSEAKSQESSTKQALVKLAWKNGLPLYVFSSADSNILAATVGKKAVSQNNNFECLYTIFTAHEPKKKSGTWMNQLAKNKKNELLYNAIGQMRVSSSNYSLEREFVLYGAEQSTTLFKNELAAIVIKVENEKLEHSRESLSVGSMIAIVPSGVHGIASKGEPSPLIERWKSGGSCDCGGWDEGCMLTVLADKKAERACASDGTRRIELFTQGRRNENKHVFSMLTFKEGVYTVDFAASISSLQAFAMCIATLHSKKAIAPSTLHRSVEAQNSEEQSFVGRASISSKSTQHGTATSYVLPDHPPLSPVRRA